MESVRDSDIAHYEGLVRKTAARYVPLVPSMDFDDLAAVFRIKVWKALVAYDPSKCRTTRDRYVFMCVKNQGKDILKIQGRHPEPLYIEDVAPHNDTGNGVIRDAFELKYLIHREDQAFSDVEDEGPLIPSTLTDTERGVLALLYHHYEQQEMADRLGITKREVSQAVKSIREKMADWKPGTGTDTPMPVAA